ncbi:MAG: DnaJ C-terminal domain-containing protein [Bradymonadia bacterium]
MQNSRAQSFQLLGISPDASRDEIKRAYRRIAKRLHPDRRGGDLNAFRRITAAYNQLIQGDRAPSNRSQSSGGTQTKPKTQNQEPTRTTGRTVSSDSADTTVRFKDFRFEWSKQFERAERRRKAKASSRKTESTQQQEINSGHVSSVPTDDAEAWRLWRSHVKANDEMSEPQQHREVSDSFVPEGGTYTDASIDSTLSGRVVGWFKKQKRHFQAIKPVDKGENVTLRLRTSDQTLLFGGHHRIALQRLAACPSCRGESERSCSICRNTGRVKVREEVTVYVPPGAVSGTQIKVPGKGTAGLLDHSDGDLILIVEHELPTGFRAQGLDLIGAFRVDKNLAMRGGIVSVDVPRGKVKVRIPPGTENGDRLKLKGQGIPSSISNLSGDVYLDLNVGSVW